VSPRSPNPHPSSAFAKYGSSGGEKPKAILCAPSEDIRGRIRRTKKPLSHE
jgi:hypothetical protein